MDPARDARAGPADEPRVRDDLHARLAGVWRGSRQGPVVLSHQGTDHRGEDGRDTREARGRCRRHYHRLPGVGQDPVGREVHDPQEGGGRDRARPVLRQAALDQRDRRDARQGAAQGARGRRRVHHPGRAVRGRAATRRIRFKPWRRLQAHEARAAQEGTRGLSQVPIAPWQSEHLHYALGRPEPRRDVARIRIQHVALDSRHPLGREEDARHSHPGDRHRSARACTLGGGRAEEGQAGAPVGTQGHGNAHDGRDRPHARGRDRERATGVCDRRTGSERGDRVARSAAGR